MSKRESILVNDKGLNARQSMLVDAMQAIGEKCGNDIEGQFGRVAAITMDNVKINSSDLDFEFTCEGDDNVEANEAEVIIYNLSTDTVKQFKKDKKISITAGYKDDTGVVFSGVIVKVVDKFDGCDRITTISALDDLSRKEKQISSISYAAGTKASYILKDLCKRLGLPIAVFSIKTDHTYSETVSVDGNISEKIQEYANVCGVSAYINKGQVYVRSLKEGDDIQFYVHMSTGLIGSPEEFEEDIDTAGETGGSGSSSSGGINISAYGKITRKYKYKSSGYALGYHTGVDVVLSNKSIKSFTNGSVASKAYSSAWGNYCIIQSDDGKYCLYAHMANPCPLAVGQKVQAGQTVIGTMGSTGNSTGPHLHFEVRTSRDSQRSNIDPVAYLQNYRSAGAGKSGNSNGAAVHGVRFTMLLQHRITTAAKIKLESRNIWGHYRVRSWRHTFNESEATTEVEAVNA